MTKKNSITMVGLVGVKQGMTRLFTDDGTSIPVTVIKVEANRICQLKNPEKDGYYAIQVTSGTKKSSSINKAISGIFAKAKVEAGNRLIEFRTNEEDDYKIGDKLTINIFTQGQKIDVFGISKGKGFQGVVKRWNFRTQDATHGNSLAHRVPGSTGMCQTPGRVFKGKKMPGQTGRRKMVVQSLEIMRTDIERNLLLVKGAIPGSIGSEVVVKPAIKKISVA